MKLIIVSGLSGSGKSVTLDTLEDSGFYCTDNLPVSLLHELSALLRHSQKPVFKNTAVGIDARNELDGTEGINQFDEFIQQLNIDKVDYEIIFLRASKESLLKRFSETRRKHPLSDSGTSLDEAIDIEIERLSHIANHATLQVDTTHTNIHQLRDLIRDRIGFKGRKNLSLQLFSFGYKHGVPSDVDFVFDARCLPNPFWDQSLRPLTGLDPKVVEFLDKKKTAQRYLKDVHHFLEQWIPQFSSGNRNYLSVAIGCTGGQHRSVYLIEALAKLLDGRDFNIIARHRELS
ncbi:MAG: RNase adaptor protein RapZ [Cycloclasticus sp. symbiont of Poecilosclerida sp. M]|nr:MAG: RNase adaptor protein RapZ [Cycloclasticus sp. symbiont of Poecilosclerida sp. M]